MALRPGQRVTLRDGSIWTVVGLHSHFGGQAWYRLVRGGESRDSAESAIVGAVPAPEWEVGARVRLPDGTRWTVAERREGEDGGTVYVLEQTVRGGRKVALAGPHQINT
ncbi:MAG: hypothetical protein IRY92_06705 [Dactylosporangium sp.]|nr:hypothetical protein [Dactylosporangium sp.]